MFITTSWDDGHPCDLRLLELLNRFSLPATFYIPRASQLPTMSESEIRRIAEVCEVGGHTLDHLPLTSLSDQSAEHQIRKSKEWLEQITGQACQVFCPPLGKFSKKHPMMIQQAGFNGFRTVELGSTARPCFNRSLVELATSIQAHPHPRTAYLKNALRRGRVSTFFATLTQGKSNQSWVRRGELLLQQAEARNGVFHLWGHSWEIDQNEQWSELETMFELLSEWIQAGRAKARTNGQLCHPALGF